MAIVGECCGWDQETVVLSQWQAHRDLFPLQPDRTRCNRQRRVLGPAMNLVRQAVVQRLDRAPDAPCIIASLPVPVVQFSYVPQANRDWKAAGATCGPCCSKQPTIFGSQRHLLLTQGAVIRDFELAPANVTDLSAGVALLERHADLRVLADKGSLSQPRAQELGARHPILLLTVPRSNQRAQPSAALRQLHAHLRQLIETVNSQLALQFHVAITHAHRFWGLTARLHTTLAAHTRCIWLNRLRAAPQVLHVKALAFPTSSTTP